MSKLFESRAAVLEHEARERVLEKEIELAKLKIAKREWVGLERDIAAAVLDHCYGSSGVNNDMIERTTEVIRSKLKELNT